ALIVTAIGSQGQGPYYQRVYRANSDGTNFTQVANIDSTRTGGMVDIAISPNNDVFVLTVHIEEGHYKEIIFHISNNNEISRFIEISAGRDPKSIDVDSKGNVWFCTTVGVFRVVPSR
ncbi:hypothetical protein ACFLU9_02950, partial [Chloroflexota bacterium]